jgi:hypothetical protein
MTVDRQPSLASRVLGLLRPYARLYRQQFQDGTVEARCEDGLVLASGDVVAAPR